MNSKYDKRISNAQGEAIVVDVYDVLEAFGVTCPALQHLAKKVLNVGVRGHKDTAADLIDIRDSAVRAIDLEFQRTKPIKGET